MSGLSRLRRLTRLLARVFRNNQDAAQYYQDRFSHVLVDEYQDVNSLQAQIVDKIGSNHQIMAVGDDAQCIYTWRGADLIKFLVSREASLHKIFKIETNYRSSPEILNLANVFSKTERRETVYSKTLKPSRPHQDLPVVVPTMDAYQQADFFLSKVEQLVDIGVQYDDIAILYRAHYHAMELQVELIAQRIPFVITSGMRFFEQAHVKDLVAQLRFVAKPKGLNGLPSLCLPSCPKLEKKLQPSYYAWRKRHAKEKELRLDAFRQRYLQESSR